MNSQSQSPDFSPAKMLRLGHRPVALTADRSTVVWWSGRNYYGVEASGGLPPGYTIGASWRAPLRNVVMSDGGVRTFDDAFALIAPLGSARCAYEDHNGQADTVACAGPIVITHDGRGCRPTCAAHAAWRQTLSHAGGHSPDCPTPWEPATGAVLRYARPRVAKGGLLTSARSVLSPTAEGELLASARSVIGPNEPPPTVHTHARVNAHDGTGLDIRAEPRADARILTRVPNGSIIDAHQTGYNDELPPRDPTVPHCEFCRWWHVTGPDGTRGYMRVVGPGQVRDITGTGAVLATAATGQMAAPGRPPLWHDLLTFAIIASPALLPLALIPLLKIGKDEPRRPNTARRRTT